MDIAVCLNGSNESLLVIYRQSIILRVIKVIGVNYLPFFLCIPPPPLSGSVVLVIRLGIPRGGYSYVYRIELENQLH